MPLLHRYVKGIKEKKKEEKGILMTKPAFSNFAVSGFAVLCAVFIEIAGLIIIGLQIGVVKALTLVMLSTFTGLYLLRRQSFNILRRIQNEINAGHIPEHELAEGAMIIVGAILLIIPGFISDIIGLLLFLRFMRHFLWRLLSKKRIIFGRFFKTRRWQDTKKIEGDVNDYHAVAPKNSPWRTKPMGK
ncbi:MAG: FxsA cytoplasmic membrane protein [Candidatus Tokpelaia sp. JSC085]|nr:MAG: FxsA cytoplasmic membrane protein [Candidatus Tokpelaia sp. JSC085]